MLEWKYPHRQVSEEAIRLTVPLEIKYWRFTDAGSITRIRQIEMSEVKIYLFIYLELCVITQFATLLRERRDGEQGDRPNPSSGCELLSINLFLF